MKPKTTSRRSFFRKTAAASVSLALAPELLAREVEAVSPAGAPEPRWRNRQPGMHYRMLGRTGMMVSELVIGSFPYQTPDVYPLLDAMIERGINYIDTAQAYGKGAVEANIGAYLETRRLRDRVFLSTKLSGDFGYVENALAELKKSIPAAKLSDLQSKAETMMAERGALKPGYHMNYFGGQEAQLPKAWLRYLLLREYGYRDGWREKIKAHARGLLEASLRRLRTDYVDVLHCPHGNAVPEELEDGVLREVLADFKRRGLIRAAGVSFHNDVAANLAKVIEVGCYDVTMFAYNIANHAATESLMRRAKAAGIGMIAMKVARLFAMENPPEWRREKLDLTLPGTELSTFAKAYLWALQNPNLSACVAQMETLEQVAENLTVVGRKAELQPV